MTTLSCEKLRLVGRRIAADSWFPGIRELIKTNISTDLSEDDGLFIGLGKFQDALPYTMQDNYDSPLTELTLDSVVLENDYLKAVFIPELGGRLWSLFDKEHQREVVLENTQLLPNNLAIRNAWVAGGVEFNCGRIGHDEQTLSPRFAAVLHTEKFPVLRIYEFQRDRNIPFQYDCFLPADSRFLFVRCRLWNPHSYMVPMYWWSNIALREVPGSRIVTPCHEVFTNRYEGGDHILTKYAMPSGQGFDASYPSAFPYVKDNYYNIPPEQRKYECMFYPDGYGFCHVSTSRMRGRKLFIWGQNRGGRHWNRKLLGPGIDAYVELQAGLGRCQEECLPMPPRTAWEWLEGYGSLTLKPEEVLGEWDRAIDATTAELERIVPQDTLDKILHDTKQTVALQPGEIINQGSGWGALEELRSGKKLAPQLDFGQVAAPQQPWVELLTENTMTIDQPCSYLVADEWFELLKTAAKTWQVHYHLALNYFRRQDWLNAEKELLQCPNFEHNRHVLHALANVRLKQQRNPEAAQLIFKAGMLTLDDGSFIKEVLKMLLSLNEFTLMSRLLAEIKTEIRELPLIRMMRAFALAHAGDLDAAEEILVGQGEWEIPDIREGECSASQLYIFIQQKRAELAHQSFDPQKVEVPFYLDFRMR